MSEQAQQGHLEENTEYTRVLSSTRYYLSLLPVVERSAAAGSKGEEETIINLEAFKSKKQQQSKETCYYSSHRCEEQAVSAV